MVKVVTCSGNFDYVKKPLLRRFIHSGYVIAVIG